MRNAHTILLATAVFLVSGFSISCTSSSDGTLVQTEEVTEQSPLDKVYSASSVTEDISLLEDSLTEEEIGLIWGSIMIETVAGDSLEYMTYGELLRQGVVRKKKEQYDERIRAIVNGGDAKESD